MPEVKRIFANEEIISLLEQIQKEQGEKTIAKSLLFALKEYNTQKEVIRNMRGRTAFLEEENALFKQFFHYEKLSQESKNKILKGMK